MKYSYIPIDLGFDPRIHKMPVCLPLNATSVQVEVNNQIKEFKGCRKDLIAAMTLAGFEVLK